MEILKIRYDGLQKAFVILPRELKSEGFDISYRKVGYLLKELGFSLQQNQKMKQVGRHSPDRDGQFRHINDTTKTYLSASELAVSVDCKKKENIGNFKLSIPHQKPRLKFLTMIFRLPKAEKPHRMEYMTSVTMKVM